MYNYSHKFKHMNFYFILLIVAIFIALKNVQQLSATPTEKDIDECDAENEMEPFEYIPSLKGKEKKEKDKKEKEKKKKDDGKEELIKMSLSPIKIYKDIKEKRKQKKREKEEGEKREMEEKQRKEREWEEREQRKERILIAKQKFNGGSYGKLFHANTGSEARKVPKNKCVVVKLFTNFASFENSVKVMENLQKHLEKGKRKQIVEMIDYGEKNGPFGNAKGVILMEKGGDSLEEKVQNLRAIDDETLTKMAMEMAKAIREFHQIAIHLDFKPANLVYFENAAEANGQSLLKLIDFDGSHWIGLGQSGENADQMEKVQFGHVTPIRYKSPEQFKEQKLLSRKTDIWSFGVSLYQIILCAKPPIIFSKSLQSLLSLYRGFTISLSENKINGNIVYDEEWLNESNYQINEVLTFWHLYPINMRLITNLLHLNPQKRLSAKGIVQFLNGKCELEELLNIEGNDAWEIFIFNKIKMKNLKELILGKNGKNSELYKKLEKVIETQQKLLSAEAKLEEKCDTKGTNFE